jgi:peptidoglycan/xylan/chitin deacetylase (PgdA/CDA1 family)
LNLLLSRVKGRYARTAARALARRVIKMQNTRPLISFTFDDFPLSALIIAGDILRRYDARGTYYASLGLMGQVAPTGRIFDEADLLLLVEQGHELGCHTFSHSHAYKTSPVDFEASITRNVEALAAILPEVTMKTLSYPIGNPRAETKRRAARHYQACRGGGQTLNKSRLDLNLVSAFFIEQSRDDPDAIARMIDQTCDHGGWLVFATHDVDPAPTRFGCTPSFFETVVRRATESGAAILPISRALREVNGFRNQ